MDRLSATFRGKIHELANLSKVWGVDDQIINLVRIIIDYLVRRGVEEPDIGVSDSGDIDLRWIRGNTVIYCLVSEKNMCVSFTEEYKHETYIIPAKNDPITEYTDYLKNILLKK